MAMSKKKLLMWALIGGVAGYFFLRRKKAPQVVVVTVPVLPTDTMMPGSVQPAIEGVIKNGQELSFLR
jgi:hypothetical protein